MVEEQSKRIEHEITKVVDDLDKSYLRKMQVQMHYCAAKCCENNDLSMDSVQNCVERCSQPLTRAQSYVQNQLQNFQKKLNHCVLECNEEIRDRMPVKPSQDEITKYTIEFQSCATGCVDRHISLIPNLIKKMKQTLSQGNLPDN